VFVVFFIGARVWKVKMDSQVKYGFVVQTQSGQMSKAHKLPSHREARVTFGGRPFSREMFDVPESNVVFC
jgi:hypothetical protein